MVVTSTYLHVMPFEASVIWRIGAINLHCFVKNKYARRRHLLKDISGNLLIWEEYISPNNTFLHHIKLWKTHCLSSYINRWLWIFFLRFRFHCVFALVIMLHEWLRVDCLTARTKHLCCLHLYLSKKCFLLVECVCKTCVTIWLY